MAEIYRLPEKGWSENFYAEFVVRKDGDHLVATNGWMCAPQRGDEIMSLVQEKLQEIAITRGTKVVHKFEAFSIGGKKLIQRHYDYVWSGRSFDGNPVYEREYLP